MGQESILHAGAGTKRCVYCGEDCSNRPRVRDREGRYACRACADAAGGVDPEIVLAPEPVEVIDDARKAGTIDEPSPTAMCPVCMHSIPEGNTMCFRCHYDSKAGLTERTRVGTRELGREGLQCAGCGYDLRGLRAMRCPECGEHVRPRSVSKRQAWPFRDEASRRAYLAPMILMVVSLGILLPWQSSLSGADSIGPYLIEWAVGTVIGLVVFYVCSAAWIGFDAPLPLNLIRLAAVVATMDLARLAMFELLGPFAYFMRLVMLVLGLLYVILLSKVLELEIVDAIAVALIFMVVRLVLSFYVLST